VLSSYFTYPLVKNLDSHYPEKYDYPAVAWVLSYNFKSLLEGKMFTPEKYFDAPILYPFSHTLAHFDSWLIPSIFLYGPAFVVTQNHIISTNFVIIASFALSFLAAFYALKGLFRNPHASFVGALVFAFSPIPTARFIVGHLEYLPRFFIPIFFLFLKKFLDKPGIKYAFLLSLVFTLNFLTNIQLSLFLLVLGGFVFVYYSILKYKEKNFRLWFSSIIKYCLIGLVFVPFLFYSHYQYLDFSLKEGITRGLSEAAFYSARVYDYFGGLPNNLLFGNFYRLIEPFRSPGKEGPWFNYGEHTLFPGFLATLISLCVAIKLLKGKREPRWSYVWFLTLMTGIILSFGPYLKVGEFTLKLPYFFLYKIFPLLGASRTPTRIALVFLFPLAVMVAQGVKSLLKSGTRKLYKRLIFGLLVFVLLIEYKHSITTEKFNLPQFPDLDLKGKVVLFLPLPRSVYEAGIASKYFFYQASEDFNMVNAYTGMEFLIEDSQALFEDLSTYKFDKRWFEILKTLGVEYVTLDKGEIAEKPEIENLLNKNLNTLKPLVVYDSGNWIVLDVGKYKSTDCYKDGEGNINIDISLEKGIYKVTNNSSCNLRFLYRKRYLSQEIKLPGRKMKVYLKLKPYLLKGESYEKSL